MSHLLVILAVSGSAAACGAPQYDADEPTDRPRPPPPAAPVDGCAAITTCGACLSAPPQASGRTCHWCPQSRTCEGYREIERSGVLYEQNCAPQLMGEPTSCALDDVETRRQVVAEHIARSVEGFHPEGASVAGRIEQPAAVAIPVRGRRCYRVAVVFGDYEFADAEVGDIRPYLRIRLSSGQVVDAGEGRPLAAQTGQVHSRTLASVVDAGCGLQAGRLELEIHDRTSNPPPDWPTRAVGPYEYQVYVREMTAQDVADLRAGHREGDAADVRAACAACAASGERAECLRRRGVRPGECR
ncbi:MAG: hypothetical protein HYY06_20470 [Deltaproteobacteria bacterium]|nr:hypothetical protein [Deltaproteobacteria bacterium]